MNDHCLPRLKMYWINKGDTAATCERKWNFSLGGNALWPRGVVVSTLTSHVRGAGFDSRPG